MKHIVTLSGTLTAICILLCINASGQGVAGMYSIADQTTGSASTDKAVASTSQSVMAKNGMTATPVNYTSFTKPYKNTSKEAVEANKGYENHPEAGLLFLGTPCDNCYELIGQRTETTKTFQKEGVTADGGKDVMKQTSTMPMHYRDAAGNWRTITVNLQPDDTHKGVYAAMAQPAPVVINTASGFSSLGKAGENIMFNNKLELVYVKPDGSETSLGIANWANHTAGDDGAYVTNAWPGVDIEMHTVRGAVKTSFNINHAMPAYANGKLLIRDHIQTDKGLSLVVRDGTKAGGDGKTHTIGILDVKDASGDEEYAISGATVYDRPDPKNTFHPLEYILSQNNTLDIELPGSYLNKPESAYPVVVDPLVSLATGATPLVNGASYNAAWTAHEGCEYIDSAWTPINSTLTDIQFSFAYTTTTVAMDYIGFNFYLGTCGSPSTATGYAWSCNSFLPGTCTSAGGATYSIWAASTTTGTTSGLGSCVSAPSCPSYPLDIKMYFYQNWATTAACATTYVVASAPLIITVFGHTVELTTAGVTGTPATVCAGENVTLAATGTYGVPPYTYSWLPGPVTGAPVVVNPTVTTTYTLTVTDACGITTGGTSTITVNPTTPITGTLSMCIGNTTTLADATAGGVWSSSTPAVATVVAGSGVVTGVSTGTSTITYTTTAGCKAYAIVTVTPLPVAITGTPEMCQGLTTTLNDVTPGGAWSSSDVAIATVGAATGVVTGVAGGNATISYGTLGCDATILVTINPTPATPVPANSSPICAGGTLDLTATDATTGVTYSWKGPGGFTSATQDTSIDPANTSAGGTYTLTVTSPAGCISLPATTVVTINPVPVISIDSFKGPTTCGGTNGYIVLNVSGVPSGTSYILTYLDNGASFGAVGTTTASGTITKAGLDSGTYAGIYITTTPAGCLSNVADTVTLNDPLPPPPPIVTNNEPICIGQTLILSAEDTVHGGIYTWIHPNGSSTADQDTLTVPNTTFADTGLYTVSYDVANCFSYATEFIHIYPPVILTNITPATAMRYGSTVQLNVDGALYYWWTPDDGSLNNPNINNPIATPTVATIYTVIGTNISGCSDTLSVAITITDQTPVIIPSAFTPNDDGLNDIFRLANLSTQKLVEFSVYNRWGQLIYHNESDPKAGWDGTFNGVKQDMGVYNYYIILSSADGTNQVYKGDVTLIR